MQKTIYFRLPGDVEGAKRVLARLAELVELVNMEKEEQAIEPAFFKGNLSDYPDWFSGAFNDRSRLALLETACGYDPGDLEEWDLESWYDDFFAIPAYTFSVQAGSGAGEQELVFEVEEKDYGGEKAHAWLVLAAGAEQVRV